MRIILLFLDGVGIGAADPERNPFFAAPPPGISALLGGRLPSLRNRHPAGRHALCIPANATLRVDGLPQSGTGQATLYTGINCARLIGKHFGPYLYSTLKPVVAESNIFRAAARMRPDSAPALANAFPERFFEYVRSGRTHVVAGAWSALRSGVRMRREEDLLAGEGISTDITGQRWREVFNPAVPVITPYEAGARLARIARDHSFTLFEYFQTDKAGHERSMHEAQAALARVDQMLVGLVDGIDLHRTLVIVTSDHGNMEDLSTKSHTRNPVPVLLIGKGREEAARRIHSLAHVTPAVVKLLAES